MISYIEKIFSGEENIFSTLAWKIFLFMAFMYLAGRAIGSFLYFVTH